MNFTRRKMMQTVLLGGPVLAASGARLALAASYQPSLFMLGGITPSTSASLLFSILDPIVSQNVPVGCVVEFADDSGKTLSPDSELAALLRNLAENYSGLIEFISFVPDLANETPYFRMRRASEAHSNCRGVLGRGAACLSLATQMPEGAIGEISEIRAGGFRNLLLLPQHSRAAGYWKTDTGILQFYGGTPIATAGETPIETVLNRLDTKEETLIVYMSLDESLETDADAFSLGASLGDALSTKNWSGNIFSTLPSEIHLHSTDPFGRLIAINVEGKDDPAVVAFLGDLIAANIPHSVTATVGAPSEDLCLRVLEDQTPFEISTRMKIAGTSCLLANSGDLPLLSEFTAAGVEIISVPDASSEFAGLDGDGLFHLPIAHSFDGSSTIRSPKDFSDDLVNEIGSQNDVAITITAAAIQNSTAAQAITEALKTSETSGLGIPVSLSEFRDTVAPTDQKYRLLAAKNFQKSLASNERLQNDENEQAELAKDAKTAWRFFELFTNSETGLAPGTVWKEGESRSSYPFATMWDVGSHIMALISAHKLNLIDDAEFEDRTLRLLAHLPTTSRANGLILPQTSVSITGRQAGEKGFDASDAGRLLISLRALDLHVGGTMSIAEIVAGWEFQKTIKDGKIRSVRDDRFTAPLESIYTHYVSRGLALWGLSIDTPFVGYANEDLMDAQMRILDIAAEYELISTEPHVLEAVEMGYSEPAQTLADVLYAQQVSQYEKSDVLVCASEGPLNREPWFSYQGFKIGDDDPWKVKIINNLPRYQTIGFKRAVTMVSSKSAYLWSAVRPESYSQELVDYVRKNARLDELGFASGVFSATGLPTANYSDLNTNGIILEALAYRKLGNRPLI